MRNNSKSKQASDRVKADSLLNVRIKPFLKIFLPLTTLVAAGLSTFYQIQTNLIYREISSTERREIETKVELIGIHFTTIRADLLILSKQHELGIILDSSNAPETITTFQSVLSQEYLAISQTKQVYDQIRVVDTMGQELVRVNFNRGHPHIVPNQQLQNQSERYWFQETIMLEKGQVFVSPLDLNIDFGKIEQPLKPTIRFGTPVFNDRQELQGIVVINYLAESFLHNLSAQHSQSFGHILLLNQEGYWLKAILPKDEWGFMYNDDRRDRTFAKTYPQAWQLIREQETGQVQTEDGLYTFTTIYPLVQQHKNHLNLFPITPFEGDNYAYQWKLITHVPTDILIQRSQAIGHQLLVLLALLTGLIAIAAILVVQATLKHEHSDRQAKGLEQTLQDLYRNQAQLVQTEKMASLGQLVAGVAHEINNPVNFIHGNLIHAQGYLEDAIRLVDLYQFHYPQSHPEIDEEIDEIDLEFLKQDAYNMFISMTVGTNRIREIVKSLRTFSRLDESEIKEVNLHDGIDSTLTILQTRLRAQDWRPEIEIVKEYQELPAIECYAGQLNQVFMNIISNAIDALEERDRDRTFTQIEDDPSTIKIQTQVIDRHIVISITDNGPGISQSTQAKLFDPFFTTKSVGKGTGLGLSISYQIITEKHQGSLSCTSHSGETRFIIKIPIK